MTEILFARKTDVDTISGYFSGGVLTALHGGTGIAATFVIGDILYANSTTTLAKLADIATGNALISGGVGAAPTWGKIALTTHVSGILPPLNGGTGIAATLVIGDLLYANSTTTLAQLADVATGNALVSGGVGTAPSWSKIGLTTHVSGILPVANGGTSFATYAVGDLLYADTTATLAKLAGVATGNVIISGGVSTAFSWGKVGLTTHISGTLGTANGGTGVANNAASTVTISGSFATTLTLTNTTAVTLPTAGTLATLAGAEAFTNKTYNGNTWTAGTGVLTIAASKTLTASNTLTFTGTDSSSVAFGAGGTVTYTSNNLSVFAATTSAQLAGIISDETGTGALTFATSPTFTGSIIMNGNTFQISTPTPTGTSASGIDVAGNGEILFIMNESGRTTVRYGLTLGNYAEFSAFSNSQVLNGLIIGTNPAKPIIYGTNNIERGRMDETGNFVWGTAALATNATDGFIYVPTTAGTPTGVPTAKTGRVAMVFDSTNKKLYFYNGAWQRAQVTAVDAIYA